MEEILMIITIISSIMVVIEKNPVHSVLYLIIAFINVTGILIIWKMDYIGLMIIIVYVGAIAILFLFVIMMLNIKMIEITERKIRNIPIGGIIGSILLIEMIYIIRKEIKNTKVMEYRNWDKESISISLIENIGIIIFEKYSALIIIASLILLVGMIGAIKLSKEC